MRPWSLLVIERLDNDLASMVWFHPNVPTFSASIRSISNIDIVEADNLNCLPTLLVISYSSSSLLQLMEVLELPKCLWTKFSSGDYRFPSSSRAQRSPSRDKTRVHRATERERERDGVEADAAIHCKRQALRLPGTELFWVSSELAPPLVRADRRAPDPQRPAEVLLQAAAYPRPQEIQWRKELTNSVQLIGIVSTPVEARDLPSGKVVAWTRLAVRKSPTDTTWINLTFWDELALTASQHLEKGQQIFVSGRLVSDVVESDEGKQQTFYKVVVQQLNFIERNLSPFALNDHASGRNFGSDPVHNNSSTVELWQAFFANPLEWWDNRKTRYTFSSLNDPMYRMKRDCSIMMCSSHSLCHICVDNHDCS
ncbi:uncharacterized protein LOC120292666 [Eucalyptus grandis]|uniref:uncharacterized protein LOC120292666 n=1 Tax=Eucalyptus grandis TaxID=71139 RepID=UPI00192E887F|nr:uncharacterized protein LOC120292666 [Eucalyptus grandis]